MQLIPHGDVPVAKYIAFQVSYREFVQTKLTPTRPLPPTLHLLKSEMKDNVKHSSQKRQ